MGLAAMRANSTHDHLGPPTLPAMRCSPPAVSSHGSPQPSASGGKAASSGSPRRCRQPKKPATEAVPVAAGDAAARSRQPPALPAEAAAAAMPDHDVLLGCPKCRYAKNGCGVCRVNPAMARHKQLRWQPAAGRPQTVRPLQYLLQHLLQYLMSTLTDSLTARTTRHLQVRLCSFYPVLR